MEYGFFIGLLTKIYRAYLSSDTYRIFQGIENSVKHMVQKSRVVNWLLDYKGLENHLEDSFLSKLLRGFQMAWLERWLKSSLIMKFLLNESVLRTMILFQIFSYIFLSTMISVALSVGLIGLLMLYRMVHPVTTRKPKVLIFAMGLVTATMVFSLVMNQVSSDGFTIWLIYFSTFMFAASVLGTFSDKRFFHDCLFIIAMMIGITGMHGIYQRIVGVPIDPAWLDEEATGLGIRVYSVFGNPNVYGEFLVLGLPLMFAGMNQHKHFLMKVFYGGVFALGGLNVVLTLSRGSMMSLAIALVLIVLFKDRKYLPVLILGLLLSPYFVPESIINRILSIFQGGDTSISFRVSIYTASLDMLKDYFVEGVGLGNFKVLYKAYAYSAAKSFHAHNTLLMLMIELGVVGLMAWGFYFITWIREIFSAQKAHNAYAYYAFAAFAGVLGCSVQGMVDHIFHSYDILFFYVIIMSVGVIAAQIARKEGGMDAEN